MLANAARTSRPVAPGELTRDRLLQGLARCAGCGHTLKVVHRPCVGRRDASASYYCKNAAKEHHVEHRAFAVLPNVLDEFVDDRSPAQTRDRSEARRRRWAANRELEQAQAEEAEADADLVRRRRGLRQALDRQNCFSGGLAKRQQRVRRRACAELRSLSAAD